MTPREGCVVGMLEESEPARVEFVQQFDYSWQAASVFEEPVLHNLVQEQGKLKAWRVNQRFIHHISDRIQRADGRTTASSISQGSGACA